MNSLVSVIVPTYNRKHLLPECLDAILAQSYVPLEVVLVDDGSTDGTGEFVRSAYGQRVRYVALEHSGLPAVARNAGIDTASGDFLAFCDSDDYWMPGKIEAQMAGLLASGCNLSCSDAVVAGAGGRTLLEGYAFRCRDRRLDLLRGNFIVTSSVLLRKELLNGRRFTTRPVFRAYEDYVLWLSLFSMLKIDLRREPLLYYRQEAGSLSRALRRRDVPVQFLIMLTQPAFLRHPLIWAEKAARYLAAFARGG
jgi:glycosyltransferase involved in cell wall biosynthesis